MPRMRVVCRAVVFPRMCDGVVRGRRVEAVQNVLCQELPRSAMEAVKVHGREATDHVLRVDGIFEKLVAHLEEGGGGQKTVGSSLMLRAYPWHLNVKCKGQCYSKGGKGELLQT